MTQLEDLDRQIALASPKVGPPISSHSHYWKRTKKRFCKNLVLAHFTHGLQSW